MDLFLFWTWWCFFYALVILAIGLCLPLVSGWDVARNSASLTEYVIFYSTLHFIAIIYFLIYHFQSGNFQKLFHNCAKKFVHLKTFLQRCCHRNNYSLKNSNHRDDDTHGFHPSAEDPDEENENENETYHSKIVGKHGLKFGIQVSTIVFVIVILVELSYFVQARMVVGTECQLDDKGVFIVTQLIYVLMQAHFIITTKKEILDQSKSFLQFGFAHMAATTICTGFFLTVHDDVINLYPKYKKLKEGEALHHDAREKRSVPNFRVNITKPCSLSSYIHENEKQIKPFTFQFSMFYVYCCAIIFVLLFLHYRKISKNRIDSVAGLKNSGDRKATFSTSAGLSLIVLGVIASLLTFNSESNLYAIIFLMFLHTQAIVVGLLALCKIFYVPCKIKTNTGKNHVVFLFFYFIIMISVTMKIISKNITEQQVEHESSKMIVETAETVLDLVQLFLQGLLILIGFYVDVDDRILRRRIMPREILIHLAATNLSDLISNIFRRKTTDYFHFLKEHFDHDGNVVEILHGGSEGSQLSMEIVATIMGSILVPCISFHRFYSIVCLLKLHKAWTPKEHNRSSNEVVESGGIRESHL